jgi:hypothetical protein
VGPLSLVSTTEELLGIKSSGSGLEIRDYGSRDPLRSPRGALYPQKLSLTPSTSCGLSVGILRSQIPATEFIYIYLHSTIRVHGLIAYLVKHRDKFNYITCPVTPYSSVGTEFGCGFDTQGTGLVSY